MLILVIWSFNRECSISLKHKAKVLSALRSFQE